MHFARLIFKGIFFFGSSCTDIDFMLDSEYTFHILRKFYFVNDGQACFMDKAIKNY